MVVSDTCAVRVCRANARPHPIRCVATQIVPLASASRCTVTGSRLGLGGGPAGRSPRSRTTWAGVSGFGWVRNRVRLWRSNNINTVGSIRIPTCRPASRVEAVKILPPNANVAAGEMTRSTFDLVALRGPVRAGRDRRRSRRHGLMGGDQPGQVGHPQVRGHALDPGTSDAEVDDRQVRPEPDRQTRSSWAQPEVATGHTHVPRRRHHRIELDRATLPS